ncbi:DUF3983 domain-containing protein [Cytobacillus oceanisediminis]|uniref:DUF3983 domain-containing protein n=1 Tax=Cytobacillus oceanisediminis TaxID=665099 RepID=UPI002042641E|nr:DUF3983 domain-containing protein [Cytobacillus oceanisediminis]MCM3527867.1 DUF3983 domain-containing protein [Cytobacillus oceanisediminis]
MANRTKQKRRLGKSLARRRKEVNQDRTARAWRNLFVASGVLKGLTKFVLCFINEK